MEKVKVGIIGTGGISHAHMTGYKAIPDRVEMTAVCDIDEEKVKAYAAKFNVPRWYTDYNEMLAKENLDAVSVTTWNAAHKGAAIAALNAGVNVICEKPMAMNAEEAEEMKAAAERNGRVLQIGFVRRYGEDAAMIKKFIDGGTLGDLYYAKATYLRRSGCPGGWFGDKSYSGGGPLIDLGVHVMDLVRYLAGCPKPIAAYGVTYNNLGPDRASGAKSNLGYESKQTSSKFKFDVEDFTSAMIASPFACQPRYPPPERNANTAQTSAAFFRAISFPLLSYHLPVNILQNILFFLFVFLTFMFFPI